jgi:4a-hydroxytetrahydrobiopterin dehydratase
MSVLPPEQLAAAVLDLDGWEVRDGALRKRYSFDDFAGALAFANRVGEAAEAADHHPDLLVTWGACEVAWVTHSAGGITDNDVSMARRSEELAA